MVQNTRDLLERALELPPVERLRLARDLVASVEDDSAAVEDEELAALEPELVAELRRRADQVRSGEAKPGFPVDEALREIEQVLSARRPKRGQGR